MVAFRWLRMPTPSHCRPCPAAATLARAANVARDEWPFPLPEAAGAPPEAAPAATTNTVVASFARQGCRLSMPPTLSVAALAEAACAADEVAVDAADPLRYLRATPPTAAGAALMETAVGEAAADGEQVGAAVAAALLCDGLPHAASSGATSATPPQESFYSCRRGTAGARGRACCRPLAARPRTPSLLRCRLCCFPTCAPVARHPSNGSTGPCCS